jgi:hypothetical protein
MTMATIGPALTLATAFWISGRLAKVHLPCRKRPPRRMTARRCDAPT